MRRAIRALIQADEAGKRLSDGICAWPFRIRPALTEAGDGKTHRICLGIFRPKADARGHTWPEGFNQHISLRRQGSRGALAFFRFQIQHHGTLAAIETHRHDGDRILGRAKPARPIAFRRFKLDDISAAGGQHHAAIGPGNALAGIQHPKPLIGPHRFIHRVSSSAKSCLS